MAPNRVRVRCWGEVLDFLRTQPKHTTMWIPRSSGLGHPRHWPGMRRSTGLPKGQLQDWRCVGPDGGGLHILAYPLGFRCHYDQVDPSVSLAKHLAVDVIGGDCEVSA